MKEFKGRIFYKGFKLELQFCSESLRTAAQLLGQSKYQVKTYFVYEPINPPYLEVNAKAGDEPTKQLLGTHLWMTLEKAKYKINHRKDETT